ncbi:MAG: hydrolase TatD [Candidatus Omnitrophica bacterium CG11_big_fil_rev_8_21_14_0_20_45_26]|uniref:Hydrolase TatD n=1 Tax=Candidatus Abzuiibacterium crystallinum TaxID=1974748 RepID=A0A2H0LRP4_9BACT|nr:MAG: hydrolase TatD [Candidatus Omnitrophica bacterium CG11_big_fil_rev_8_21_14_0_20_45_26]PIW63531.1 MAG: hypothetical protein COW12_10020 [Candidatus Omnitrophica bacterium CG12_big_fil_rev_8_21_14_0_65_45_16]
MKLFDTHTHLFFPDFKEDFEKVLERAAAAGVGYFLNVGTNNDTSHQSLQLAKKFPNMYAAVGIHPNEAGTAHPEHLAEFDEWLRDPKVVAVGEIGLDYYRHHADPAIQRQTFINFLKIAERHQKPIILHIRDAYDDVIQILKDFLPPPIRGVSHCFSGTPTHLEQLVHLGLHISFAGPLTYPKNDVLREAAALCPKNKLLVETDAPYLPPQSARGKRNEPARMVETAERLAALHRMPLDVFSEQLLENCRNLFGLSPACVSSA